MASALLKICSMRSRIGQRCRHRIEAQPMAMRSLLMLNVATMSLYHHVRDKDDLLIGMMDAAFAEWELSRPEVGAGWKEVLTEAARHMWRVFRRHLWRRRRTR
jgi:AcrR family transcriptional regulator